MSSESTYILRRWHRVLRRKTQEGTIPEVLTEVRDFINYCRNTGKFVSDPKDREYLRSLLLQWGEFIAQHSEDAEYLDLSLLPFEEEVAVETERKAILFAVFVVLAVFSAILTAIFQNQIATVGDSIMWWLEGRATPTPTVAIPGIDRIEIFMNGSQLDVDQLPRLTSGEAVVLEVIVFDTNGKRYTSDELVCKWSVVPLGDEDVSINTELCKTFYVPSKEYSSQTVVAEVKGLEQQFQPSVPISMTFDIVK